MTEPLADVVSYRGVELLVYEEHNGIWQWAFYPKIGEGVSKYGKVKGTRETALAACQSAIDEWLKTKRVGRSGP